MRHRLLANSQTSWGGETRVIPTAGQRGSRVASSVRYRDGRNKLRSSPAPCRTPPLPNRVNAMQVASAARVRAPARPVTASPRQLSKALHPDLIEIPYREQHTIDCRDNRQDFAPVIDHVQPMGEGCLLKYMRLVIQGVKRIIFPGRDQFALHRQASNRASQREAIPLQRETN
jgi:hypothetical protein